MSPDCVIVALDSQDNRPEICDRLERQPNLKILALAAERNSCIFYWATFNIRSTRGETSEQGILDAPRGRPPVGGVTFFPESSTRIN